MATCDLPSSSPSVIVLVMVLLSSSGPRSGIDPTSSLIPIPSSFESCAMSIPVAFRYFTVALLARSLKEATLSPVYSFVTLLTLSASSILSTTNSTFFMSPRPIVRGMLTEDGTAVGFFVFSLRSYCYSRSVQPMARSFLSSRRNDVPVGACDL